MAGTKVVEVRFDAEVHDLTEEQVFGLLSEFDPDYSISVGLGYGGKASSVLFQVAADNAVQTGERVKAVSEALGLTVTDIEVLDPDEYEERALAEDVG